jgi:hypothetical protein
MFLFNHKRRTHTAINPVTTLQEALGHVVSLRGVDDLLVVMREVVCLRVKRSFVSDNQPQRHRGADHPIEGENEEMAELGKDGNRGSSNKWSKVRKPLWGNNPGQGDGMHRIINLPSRANIPTSGNSTNQQGTVLVIFVGARRTMQAVM